MENLREEWKASQTSPVRAFKDFAGHFVRSDEWTDEIADWWILKCGESYELGKHDARSHYYERANLDGRSEMTEVMDDWIENYKIKYAGCGMADSFLALKELSEFCNNLVDKAINAHVNK